MKDVLIVALSVCFLIAAAPQTTARRGPVAVAELDDPAGDVEGGMTGSGNQRAPYDIVHLTITGDGKNVLIAATLKEIPAGMFASSVVTLYFDTDNNKATGVSAFSSGAPGFEYTSAVEACIKYSNGGSACMGGFGGKDVKVQSRYGAADVYKFTGSNWAAKESVRSSLDAAETPLDGKVLKASISYADLHAKSGQVVRILALESDGIDGAKDFPEVLLELK